MWERVEISFIWKLSTSHLAIDNDVTCHWHGVIIDTITSLIQYGSDHIPDVIAWYHINILYLASCIIDMIDMIAAMLDNHVWHHINVHIMDAITLMWSYLWYGLITYKIISLAWSYHWCDHAGKMISLILKSFCWHDHIIDMSMSVKLSSEQLSIDMIGIGWCDSYFWLSWSTLMEMTGIFDWHDWITDIVPNFKFIMSFHRRWYYVPIEQWTDGRRKVAP